MKLAPIPLLAVAAAIALTFTFASRASCDWPPGGVALCASGVCQATAPVPCPDGQGGAFIVWADYRNDVLSNGNDDLYVQHITASGAIAPGWPADGVPVCTNPAAQLRGASVPDGLGVKSQEVVHRGS